MAAAGISASAQAQYFGSAKVAEEDNDTTVIASPAETVSDDAEENIEVYEEPKANTRAIVWRTDTVAVTEQLPDSLRYRPRTLEELEEYLDTLETWRYDRLMGTKPLPKTFFLPSVFVAHQFPDTTSAFTPELSGNPGFEWIEEENALQRKINAINYYLFSTHPERVTYNINLLPEAPKEYHAVVDPEKHTIKIEETIDKAQIATPIELKPGRKRHWIRTFTASLQFSQAYISPNWYQGGENALNANAQLYYNVKLNDKYHPNIIFETTAQYNLGLNNAPNDTVHNYNITNDIFQVNTNFGVKAVKRWYYSFTGQFKTQLLNSYHTNSNNLRSAFMSPGEFTGGIGMTYNYGNKKGTFSFNASLAPLSYSMKTCINRKLNPGNFGIDEGHKTSHHFGSTAEFNLFWRLAYNITFNSRLFAFTDYENAHADWQNKINFEINRFLTSQIQVDMRYDTNTRPCDDPSWKKLQLKEVLSIGFAYRFSTI